MNHLDMCSGIGGWAIAFRELGINTVAFCEIDDYPQKVLKKNFPGIPIFNDLKELTYEQIKERTGTRDIDLVTCSYPCQPFSVAGKQKGEEDPRHLWPDTFRIIQESKPTWFVGENVGGHIKLGLDTVLEDLASIGYDTRTFVIPASSIGAWHQRKRIWIIGHREDVENSNSRGRCRQKGVGKDNSKRVSGKKQNSNTNQTDERCTSRESTISESHNVSDTESLRSGRRSGEECRSPQWQFFQEEQEGCEIRGEVEGRSTSSGEDVSDTDIEGLERRIPGRQNQEREGELGHAGRSSSTHLQQRENWWQTESEFCGVPHGVSYGLDKGRVGRIKGLGNAIVPQIAWFIGNAIVSAQNAQEDGGE